MSNSKGSDVGTFFLGFVVGGLVGAAVALLYAPQSGEETRTMMKDKGIELKDQATETAAQARARAEALAKEAKAKAEEVQKRGQVLLDEQKTRIGKAVESGKKKVSGRGKAADESAEAPAAEGA